MNNLYKPEKTINCSGITINYIDEGKGDVIIFLHNGGGFWQTWIKQINYFSNTHRVIALDWPGFGKSDEVKQPLSLELNYTVLKDFVNKLVLKDITLVGNCIGASVAIQYKNMHPNKVKHLVLMNICPGRRLIRLNFMRYLLFKVQNKTFKSVIKNILKFIITKPPLKNVFPGILFGNPILKDDLIVKKYIEKFKEEKQTEARVNLLFGLESYSLGDFIKNDMAVSDSLLIWGVKNKVTNLKREGYHHQKLCGINKIQLVDDAGHLTMYEAPEKINALIQKHIS